MFNILFALGDPHGGHARFGQDVLGEKARRRAPRKAVQHHFDRRALRSNEGTTLIPQHHHTTQHTLQTDGIV